MYATSQPSMKDVQINHPGVQDKIYLLSETDKAVVILIIFNKREKIKIISRNTP